MTTKPLPNPVEHGQIYDPDDAPGVRKLMCRQYSACLNVADKSDWRGFSCADCFSYEQQDIFEIQRDHEAIIDRLWVASAELEQRDKISPPPFIDRSLKL
jgi:hypothetical protein